MNTQPEITEGVLYEVAIDICSDIINQYRAWNGEDEAWDYLCSSLNPEMVLDLLKDKLLPPQKKLNPFELYRIKRGFV